MSRTAHREMLAAPGPAADVARAGLEAHRTLVEAIAALAEPYRETVRLRYFEDLTSAQIADRLGLPAATVRGRLTTALERLRASLDGRPGEQKRRPLRPPSRLAVAGVAALAALTTVTVVMGSGGRGPASVLHLVIGAAAAGPRRAASAPRRLPASPSALPACHHRLTALRRESLQLERTLWVHGHHRTLFPLGADNPAATQVLLPMVTRIVRAGRTEPPPLTLECRTFACELRVLERGEAGRSLWQRALQNDGQLRQHRRALGFIGRRPARDPVSGSEMVEYRFGFTLRHPSGGALDWEGPPVGPDAVAAMATFLPADVAECETQASSLERMLATRREAASRGF